MDKEQQSKKIKKGVTIIVLIVILNIIISAVIISWRL